MTLYMNDRKIDVNESTMLDGEVWIKEAVWLDTKEYLTEEELEQLHEDRLYLHYEYVNNR